MPRQTDYTADPRIDAYIAALPDWQQAICREVRELIHAADAHVIETIKRTDRPYFVRRATSVTTKPPAPSPSGTVKTQTR